MSETPADEGGKPVAAPDADTKADEGQDDAPAAEQQESTVTEEQWQAFQELLQTVYDHREADGHDTSHVFHRKVNKRILPTYYEVIKEPIALSTIKARLNIRQYKDAAEFIRDFALIPHNAQVYNRPDAGVYQDALVIKSLLETELKKLASRKLITPEEAQLPYLGEIPAVEDMPAEDNAEEEEEEEEEDDEEGEESDDSGKGKRKGRRGRKSKAEKEGEDDAADGETTKKRRGRPPRVDTPMESRIKNIMKGVRRVKNDSGASKIGPFERLPDKTTMPEYYNEIKNPIAVDVIKKRVKRKKYQSVEQFVKDLDLMFDNAKLYNEDDSEIYQDAVELQTEAHRLAEEELAKPDTEFAMDDGRVPLTGGILHKGELYKVGDWVHIQNPNDLTKPIITQIYRTWQDPSGTKFVNACWYYRPEQTVHRYEKHFYENEVVKTGQYRDHEVDEIVDRCFVMFHTRYNKGRPRGLPEDKSVYICESRYNEEKHMFNKIKTWASCLPDEVRDKDYEMELFKEPKRMKKLPSPIAYLLKDEQKETDDFPKPEWGSDNAPPKIGAVHRRPRHPKESPPPEPTPPPPPVRQPILPPPRAELAQTPGGYSRYNALAPNTAGRNMNMTPLGGPVPRHGANPTMPLPRQNGSMRYPPNTPQPIQARTPSMSNTNYGIGGSGAHARGPGPAGANPALGAHYQAPQPVEVYHLSEQLNAAIPAHVRAQFQTDEYGHVLFFTTPPLDIDSGPPKDVELGHSARYLAAMKRRNELIERKRAAEEAAAPEIEAARAKAQKLDEDERRRKAGELFDKARKMWVEQTGAGNEKMFSELYGEEHAKKLMEEQPWRAEA